MVLELVELVMEVEETFGIIVSDEAAPQLQTVGQLHDYILACRRQTQQQGCPTGHVFRDVRRVLTDTTSLPKQAIRPSTKLKDYRADGGELLHEVMVFALRGLGLTEAAIRRYYQPRTMALFFENTPG